MRTTGDTRASSITCSIRASTSRRPATSCGRSQRRTASLRWMPCCTPRAPSPAEATDDSGRTTSPETVGCSGDVVFNDRRVRSDGDQLLVLPLVGLRRDQADRVGRGGLRRRRPCRLSVGDAEQLTAAYAFPPVAPPVAGTITLRRAAARRHRGSG